MNTAKKLLLIVLVLVQMVVFSSCSNSSSQNNSDKLQVYTSFYAMYDFAKQIGGDKADVHIMCAVGQEPHDYEPTAQDIAKLSGADVFIYNGMGMEHWVDSVVDTLNGSLIVVQTSDYAKHITETEDPHIWLNPENALSQLKSIADAFKKADSENTGYYDERFKECEEKINRLIEDYNSTAAEFKHDTIVVSHEAYANICEPLGLKQVAINGSDNGEDPTPSRMADIIRLIKGKNIKYIFTEPLSSSSVIETIADDADCGILVLDPFEGNLEGKDYFTVMYENLEAIKTALS